MLHKASEIVREISLFQAVLEKTDFGNNCFSQDFFNSFESKVLTINSETFLSKVRFFFTDNKIMKILNYIHKDSMCHKSS